jgi:hypothetical protein
MSTGERILQRGKPSEGGSRHAWGHLAAEEPMDFGVAVQVGTDPETQVKLFVGGNFAGITQYDPTKGYETRDGSGNPTIVRKYLQFDTVVVLRKGVVPVVAAEAVVADDPVYIHTSGAFYKQAGEGRSLLTRARWFSDSKTVIEDGVSTVLAEIEIDLP